VSNYCVLYWQLTARHLNIGRQPNFAAWYKEWNYGSFAARPFSTEGATYISRAAITLGIDPHSSCHCTCSKVRQTSDRTFRVVDAHRRRRRSSQKLLAVAVRSNKGIRRRSFTWYMRRQRHRRQIHPHSSSLPVSQITNCNAFTVIYCHESVVVQWMCI